MIIVLLLKVIIVIREAKKMARKNVAIQLLFSLHQAKKTRATYFFPARDWADKNDMEDDHLEKVPENFDENEKRKILIKPFVLNDIKRELW